MTLLEYLNELMECIGIKVLRRRIDLGINVIFAKGKGIMGFHFKQANGLI